MVVDVALTRSIGARKDATRGTVPIEVRKARALSWATTGVVAGGPSPLVTGTAGFAYAIGGPVGFVTSRGLSDGVHEFTNDGAATIACPIAPGSGLSRIDIIWVSHPAAGENGDTTSQPIFGVASGTASATPSAPSIPTGALEIGRNPMTSAATSTASAGNNIAQSAAVASLRGSRSYVYGNPNPVVGVTVTADVQIVTNALGITQLFNIAGQMTTLTGASFIGIVTSIGVTGEVVDPVTSRVAFRIWNSSGTLIANQGFRAMITFVGVA